MVFFYIALVRFLFYVMDSCFPPTSAYFSKVINLATVCLLLPICWALCGWKDGTVITATLLYSHFGTCLHIFPIKSESPFLLSLPCQTLLFWLDCPLLQSRLFGLPLFLPYLIPAHLLSLHFLQL